jgi:hypothetical protein
MLVDVLVKQAEAGELDLDVDALLSDAVAQLSLGSVISGNVTMTLRETFNKIIHATEMALCYDSQVNDKDKPYKYWTGSIDLEGHYKKEDWCISIDLMEWSRAVQTLLKMLDERIDLTDFLFPEE